MGIKDSEFTNASSPLSGSETFVVIQNAVNKKISVLDALKSKLQTTDDIDEGNTNLYYESKRAQHDINGISTGLISGGTLSINSTNNATFDIAALTAYFTDYTDPLNPLGTYVNYTGGSGLTLNNIATQPVTYIGIDTNLSIYQQPTFFTPDQRRTVVPLGILIHPNNTNISDASTIVELATSLGNQLYDLMDAVGPLNVSGNIFSANGANLNLNLSSGNIFRYGSNYSNDTLNPHISALNGGTAITFRYRTQTGTESADTTSINPSLYDVNGTTTAVPSNRFTIQRFFIYPNGDVRIQYGQTLYSSLTNAQSALGNESYIVDASLAQNAILRGYLIVKGNATNLTNTTTALFYEISKFGAVVGGAGTGLNSSLIIAALGYIPASTTKITTTHNANYTLVATDIDRMLITNDNNPYTYTVNPNIFQAGQYVYFINYGTSTLTIGQGTGLTLQLAGTTSTGNMTISSYGIATIRFISTTVAIIDGTGVALA